VKHTFAGWEDQRVGPEQLWRFESHQSLKSPSTSRLHVQRCAAGFQFKISLIGVGLAD
jgi:hypothetical protein